MTHYSNQVHLNYQHTCYTLLRSFIIIICIDNSIQWNFVGKVINNIFILHLKNSNTATFEKLNYNQVNIICTFQRLLKYIEYIKYVFKKENNNKKTLDLLKNVK